jgi:hypothetical protein
MSDYILRIDGLAGEFLEFQDTTPFDQPEDWKPKWHLHAESRMGEESGVKLSMELWDCEPTWLALFQGQLLEACFHATGEAHLATGSYPDVNLQVTFAEGTGRATVTLETWEADQQLSLKFVTNEEHLKAALDDLAVFLAQ